MDIARNPSVPPLDSERFFELVETLEMDTDGIRTFVCQRFINTVVEVMPLLKGFINAGDPVGVRQKAHQLKGSALNAGAKPLSEVFRELEEMGKNGDLSQAEPHWEHAQLEFERFRAYINSADYPPHRSA